jgi:hypothetical protein
MCFPKWSAGVPPAKKTTKRARRPRSSVFHAEPLKESNMAEDVNFWISSVNLLDPECEPTDEQLAMIMRAVAVEARESAARADAAFRASIEREAKAALEARRQRASIENHG